MNNEIRGAGITIAFALVALPISVSGHHSTTEYDQTSVVEIEGEVINVFWRNPHVLLEVSTTTPDGETVS